jgi:hypothetical protein
MEIVAAIEPPATTLSERLSALGTQAIAKSALPSS